jgi:hypothetical protein
MLRPRENNEARIARAEEVREREIEKLHAKIDGEAARDLDLTTVRSLSSWRT